MRAKKWLVSCLSLIFICLLLLITAVVLIDPFMHYHKPFMNLQYPLNDPRYVNDGIARHTEYGLMITGSSMSDNFYASQAEALWNMPAVKTTYSGASYHELAESIQRAAFYNPDLSVVICSLDPNMLNSAADTYAYEGCPEYLYDSNWLNDVKYVLNKDVLFETLAVINYTRAGNKTPSFDDYERFDIYSNFSKEAVTSSYVRMEKQDLSIELSDEDRLRIEKNVNENFVKLAKDNPNITFLFFVPPYSVCFWDGMLRTNQLDYLTEALSYGYSLMLSQPNIHIYGFDGCVEITNNLDRYMDTLHYDSDVNRMILEKLHANEYELTLDNIDDYYDQIKQYYVEQEEIINEYFIDD